MPNQANLVYPAMNGWVFLDGILKWSQGGGYPSSFDVYFGTSANPPYVSNVTTQTYAPSLSPNTVYYWRIDPRNSFGVTEGSVWSFKTPTSTQLAESFESLDFPPLGWYNPNNWLRSTTTPFHLTAVASKSASTTPSVLSTPKVTITPTSTLDFYYKPGSTNGYGRLQILYSPDRINWTAIGPLLTMPTVTTVWNSQSIDLSSIPGNYFLAFQVFTSTSTSTIAIDHVFGPEITAEAPGPVVMGNPADLATDVNPQVTLTWAAPTTGGISTGYRVYCDMNTDPSTLLQDSASYTYSFAEPLAYGTSYYWKVVAYNAVGDSSPNTVRSFTTWADPTVTSFPWAESFDGTTFAPIGWNNVKTAGTTNPGIWDRQTTGSSPSCSPHSGAAMARYNAFSIQSGGKAELISPPLSIPEDNYYKVTFWMYRDSGYATKTQEGVNVYISPTPGSTGGILLGTIRRYYGFAPVEDVANLWYQYTFTFPGTSASQYLIFEGVSEYGNNIFIDDIMVQAIGLPAAPALIYPADEATGLSQDGFNLSWTPNLESGDPPQYYVLFISTSEETIFDEYVYDNITTTFFDPANATEDPIELAFSTSYFWTIAAVTDAGEAVAEPLYRFTIQSNPFSGPPETIITNNISGEVTLTWDAVTNANSYKIYGTPDPFAEGSWTLLAVTDLLTYTYTRIETYKFFKVTADTHNPPD